MKKDTKLWIVAILSVLAVIGLMIAIVLVKHEVNKVRFPDSPPWTWWW